MKFTFAQPFSKILDFLGDELKAVDVDAREYGFNSKRVAILVGALDRLLAAKAVYKQAYAYSFDSLVLLIRSAVRKEDYVTLQQALEACLTLVTRVGFPETRKRAKEYHQSSREKAVKSSFFKSDG